MALLNFIKNYWQIGCLFVLVVMLVCTAQTRDMYKYQRDQARQELYVKTAVLADLTVQYKNQKKRIAVKDQEIDQWTKTFDSTHAFTLGNVPPDKCEDAILWVIRASQSR